MKKISKSLGVIGVVFVLALSCILLTACGGTSAYSVKGLSFKGSTELSVVWDDNATQQNKEEFWASQGVSNDEELISLLTQEGPEKIMYTFNEDGTLTASSPIGDGKTVYYKQSADLTLIELFTSTSSPVVSPTKLFKTDESIKLGIFDNIIDDFEPSETGNLTKLDVCFKFVDDILKYDVYISTYNVHYLCTLVKI